MNPFDVIDSRYRLERILGTGGVAEVWLAHDERLDRWVAVKVLRDGVTAGHEDDLVHSFEREARVIARLQHPNVVAVYDAGRIEGRQYLVMEYIHGFSLRQILEAQGRLDQADAVRYGQQIAGALQYAHEQGVIHCDIKPENILITEQGVPKLADFGVAETITRTLSPTEARAILGTIAYLAPEVLQGAPANPRSDVYSLAMTLYEAIAGRLPFAGSNAAAVAGQRLATPVPPLRSFARDASPEVEAVLARGLALSELDRFASAREFGAALQQAIRRPAGAAPIVAPAAAAAASRPRPVPTPAPAAGPARSRHTTTRVQRQSRPPQRSGVSGAALAAIIGIVIIALGLGGAGAWLLARDDSNNSATTTPTPSPSPTTSATPTKSPAPTNTAAPSPTPSPTPTQLPSPTSPATATKAPTATATKAPSPSPAATPSATKTP